MFSLVCAIYKKHLTKSLPICHAFQSKSRKYDWAKVAYDQAVRDRQFMADSLFDKLCSVDDQQYYENLYQTKLQKQNEQHLTDLMSKL